MISVVSKPTPHPDQVWWQGDKLTFGTITINIPDYKKFLLNQLQEMEKFLEKNIHLDVFKLPDIKAIFKV